MHSKTLRKWHAKPAGGRITVYGENASTGAQEKIVGVDVIQPSSNPASHVIAVDKDGDCHYLQL
jgi:hypothetical protein